MDAGAVAGAGATVGATIGTSEAEDLSPILRGTSTPTSSRTTVGDRLF